MYSARGARSMGYGITGLVLIVAGNIWATIAAGQLSNSSYVLTIVIDSNFSVEGSELNLVIYRGVSVSGVPNFNAAWQVIENERLYPSTITVSWQQNSQAVMNSRPPSPSLPIMQSSVVSPIFGPGESVTFDSTGGWTGPVPDQDAPDIAVITEYNDHLYPALNATATVDYTVISSPYFASTTWVSGTPDNPTALVGSPPENLLLQLTGGISTGQFVGYVGSWAKPITFSGLSASACLYMDGATPSISDGAC